MDFVNKMKKDGKLIMGIGHRVKSVSIPQLHTRDFFLNLRISTFSVGGKMKIKMLSESSFFLFQINNPDMRVQILKDFVKQHFPSTQLLDYALDVEKITTSKVHQQRMQPNMENSN